MKVLITAGGTSEYIDKVRKITNMSTGALGVTIAIEVLMNTPHEVYFVGSSQAVTMLLQKCNSFNEDFDVVDMERLNFFEVTDTESVKNTITTLLEENEIKSFVHSMAISDYTVGKVFSIEEMIKTIEEQNLSKEEIIELLKNPKTINNESKISSNMETMDIRLIKTPKIIDMIKEMSPETQLIGFKLLNGVSHEELIDVARKSLFRTNSDYIIANDLEEIKKEKEHIAYVVDKNSEEKVVSKNGIAEAIINIMKEVDFE